MTEYILKCPKEPLEESKLKILTSIRGGHDYKIAINLLEALPQLIIDQIETINKKDILMLSKTIRTSGRHVGIISRAIQKINQPNFLESFQIEDVVNDLSEMLGIRYGSYPQPEIKVNGTFSMNSHSELIYMQLYNQLRNAQQSCSQQKDSKINLLVETHRLNQEELGYLGTNQFTIETPFVRIDVSDNGSGIDEKLLPNIFDKGVSTKNDDNKLRGIGLALSGQTCYLLKGFIKVNTEVGKGTTFSMYLPQEI